MSIHGSSPALIAMASAGTRPPGAMREDPSYVATGSGKRYTNGNPADPSHASVPSENVLMPPRHCELPLVRRGGGAVVETGGMGVASNGHGPPAMRSNASAVI